MAEIPDIDFSVDCPICGGGLQYDGDDFVCERCCVSWPKNGYGGEAESHRGVNGLCEARHPEDHRSPGWLWAGEFCHLEVGHEGDHEIDPERTRQTGPVRWAPEAEAVRS